jgi:hypothetical protein
VLPVWDVALLPQVVAAARRRGHGTAESGGLRLAAALRQALLADQPPRPRPPLGSRVALLADRRAPWVAP